MADFNRILATMRAELIDASDQLIRSREDQISWLEEFIEDVKGHELRVNIAKSATTGTTVASTVMLFFPPTTIIGAIGLAGSGVASAVTSLTDYITNKVKSKDLKKMVEKSEELENRLGKLQEELRSFVETLAEKLGVDEDVAMQLVIVEGFVKIGKTYYDVVSGVVQLGTLAPKIQQIQEVMKFGYGFLDAGRVASGTGVSMVVEGGEAFYQITGATVSKVAKGFAIFGAAVSVGDMIYSWASDNPNLSSARKCLEQLKENKKQLEGSRALYKSIPN